MGEDNTDPSRRPQLSNRKRLGRQQQAKIAKLRERLREDLPSLKQLRDKLAMPPEEVERWKELLRAPPDVVEAFRLDEPECLPAPTTPTEEPASAAAPEEPAPATEEPITAPEELATAPSQAPSIQRKRPKQWVIDWLKAHPRRENEERPEYAQRMCDEMANAPDVTEARPIEYCLREVYRPRKETDFAPDPDSIIPKRR